MRSASLVVVLATVSTLYACGLSNDAFLSGRSSAALCSSGSMSLAIKSTGPVPPGCVKIEGGQIGQVPQTLTFSGITLTITGWTDKVGEAGEKVGFSFTSSGPVLYAVKASVRTFVSSGTTWVHPDGTSGPDANGISNITFCPDASDAGTPTGGSDGGGFDDGGGECDPDDVVSGTPTGGTNLTPGSVCTVDANCASQTCTAGVCAPSTLDEPCVLTAHCATDLTCVAGSCEIVIN